MTGSKWPPPLQALLDILVLGDAAGHDARWLLRELKADLATQVVRDFSFPSLLIHPGEKVI